MRAPREVLSAQDLPKKFSTTSNAKGYFGFLWEVAAYNKLFWNAEAHYVPSTRDHSCHLVGMRIFCDAHQQLLHSPADYFRGALTGDAPGARKQVIRVL